MKPKVSNASAPSKTPKNNTILYILLGLFGFILIGFSALALVAHHVVAKTTGTSLLSSSGDITLIEIQGPIYQSDDIVRRIRKFEKSSKTALLLRLNSPGGAVAPSQEIYSEIMNARKDKKI